MLTMPGLSYQNLLSPGFLRRWVRLISIGLVTAAFLANSTARVFSNSAEFQTDITAIYTVNRQGKAEVLQQITITNLTAYSYPKDYSLDLGSTRIQYLTVQDSAGTQLPFNVYERDNQMGVKVTLSQPVVGKGKAQTISIGYQNEDAASKIGNVLEVSLPKLSAVGENSHYRAELNVPIEFGEPSVVSPLNYRLEKDASYNKLKFDDAEKLTGGISALFGDRQIYEFNLSYHLDNPTITPVETQIALIPVTPFQNVYYDELLPQPLRVSPDKDGNWIATYALEPKERLTVSVRGKVVVYLKPTMAVAPVTGNLKEYLKPQPYWPVDDPEIAKLAAVYNTPEKIYQYLTDSFTYDYSRIDNLSTSRLGAKAALESPDQSLCLEFADTFITLSRAAGVPARLLTGYAYTENNRLKPLGLVKDVLHAWPEYYDYMKQAWIPVDPTWTVTTGGADYFHHLDFSHLVFAVQGLSSERPLPAGSYKFTESTGKDIEILLSDRLPEEKIIIDTEVTVPRLTQLGITRNAIVTLSSRSNTGIFQAPLKLEVANAELLEGSEMVVDQLLPFSKVEIPVKFKANQAGSPVQLITTIYGQSQTHTIGPANQLARIGIYSAAVLVGSGFTFIAFKAGGVLVQKRKR